VKKAIILLVMLLAAAGAFAAGEMEQDADGVVRLQPGQLAQESYFSDLEKIEVTGVVKYESPAAELRVGSKDYTLTAPGSRGLSGYLKEGQRLTVSGYLADEEQSGLESFRPGSMGPGAFFGNSIEALEDNITILVETVEIDGVVYELPWINGTAGGYGFRDDHRNGMFGRTGQQGDFFENRGGRFNRAAPYCY
jgi:hypothetical protein